MPATCANGPTSPGARARRGRPNIAKPILRATLDATPSKPLAYLVTEFGKPYASAKAFGNRFKSLCVMAGPPHCSAHGMRKASAIIAAENGATHDDLKAIFGWTTSKQVDLYTRQAARNKRAGKAMGLISLTVESGSETPPASEQKSDTSVPLFPTAASGGTLPRSFSRKGWPISARPSSRSARVLHPDHDFAAHESRQG